LTVRTAPLVLTLLLTACGARVPPQALPDTVELERFVAAQRRARVAVDESTLRRGQQVFLTGPCVMCHTIRGTIALARAGPDLTHLASRSTIAAGTLPNTRGNLGGWILNPQNLKPGTQMPATLLPPEDLHALVAYLETLH
jgi:cytochrome c oxidase subunit 2